MVVVIAPTASRIAATVRASSWAHDSGYGLQQRPLPDPVWTCFQARARRAWSLVHRLDESRVQQAVERRSVLDHAGAEDEVRGERGLIVQVLRGRTGRERVEVLLAREDRRTRV